MLCKLEHHLDDHEPDLVSLSQDFIRMTLEHLHQDLEHAFKQLNVLAVLLNEDLQLNGINELILGAEILAVGHRHKISPRVLQ